MSKSSKKKEIHYQTKIKLICSRILAQGIQICPKIEGVVAYSWEKKLASNAIPWGETFLGGLKSEAGLSTRVSLYRSPPLIKPPLLQWKSILISEVASHDNLLTFYYLSASEIWTDKWVVFGESGLVRVRVMGFNFNFKYISAISWRLVFLMEETKVWYRNVLLV